MQFSKKEFEEEYAKMVIATNEEFFNGNTDGAARFIATAYKAFTLLFILSNYGRESIKTTEGEIIFDAIQ